MVSEVNEPVSCHDAPVPVADELNLQLLPWEKQDRYESWGALLGTHACEYTEKEPIYLPRLRGNPTKTTVWCSSAVHCLQCYKRETRVDAAEPAKPWQRMRPLRAQANGAPP